MQKKEEEFVQGISSKDSRNLNPTTMTMTTTNMKEKKMMSVRPSVPFHIPDLPRPQDEFNIFVNNSNQPFEHVWLQRSEDGTRVIHPLEMLSESDVIENVGSIEPVKPLPMENTPFKFVEEVKELKQLAAKLCSVDEFAVDLEHNQYRSFQGLTCLMQISTRVEDYVVDTLKLRVHIGPHLREVFKDPSKKKVMHGADRDIVWLQRDFGIYICNLFDTQQASRVLDLERNTLEHLLLYFCGVAVNKAYQNADWRLRPLPEYMLKYAREDTHYLLYIYDLMRRRLFSASMHSIGGNDLLLEVYRRSNDVCMQLYEKELLTNSSYLYIYGLQEADFNSQQLSIVAGLCEWRDAVARAEDESTGYILPNKILLEIARQIPLTVNKLRRLVKSKHPYVEVNLDSIVGIIKSSIQNATAFESSARLLKERHQETVTEHNIETISTVSSQQERIVDAEVANRINTSKWLLDSIHFKEEYPKLERETVKCSRTQGNSFQPSGKVGEIKNKQDGHALDFPKKNFTILGQTRVAYTDKGPPDSAKAGTTKEMLDKRSHDFGLGNAASESKFDTHPKVTEQSIEVASTVSSQWERTDDGEGVNRVNEETIKCSSACVHFKEEVASVVSYQQESIDDGGDVNRVNQQTIKEEDCKHEPEIAESSRNPQEISFQPSGKVEEIKKEKDGDTLDLPKEFSIILGQTRHTHTREGNSDSAKPLSGASQSMFDTDSKGRVEHMKHSVVFPCQSVISNNEQLKPLAINNQENSNATGITKLKKMASLGKEPVPLHDFPTVFNTMFAYRDNADKGSKLDAVVETISLSKFQKCFQLKREKEDSRQIERAQEPDCGSQLRAFRLKQGQEEKSLTEGDEGFKSLLNSREENNSSIISRFRKQNSIGPCCILETRHVDEPRWS